MEPAAGRFEPFGSLHLALVGLFLVGAVGVVLLGRSLRGTPRALTLGRWWAVAIACVTVPSQVYQLVPAEFEPGSSLPLQLCDLAWVTAVWALWTQARVPVALTYFWGLTLSVQGILTPSLVEAFPDPRFFVFWALHLLIVWAAILAFWGWRHSAAWVRVVALLILAGGVAVGQLMLEVPRRPSILRPGVQVRPK